MYYPCSENKSADQLRGNREADLRLCLPYAKCWFSHDAAQLVFKVYGKFGSSVRANTKTMKHVGLIMRNPAFCICKNKGTAHLPGNHTADQRFCFFYIDITTRLQPESKISNLWPAIFCDCTAWFVLNLETQKTGFLITQLKYLFDLMLYVHGKQLRSCCYLTTLILGKPLGGYRQSYCSRYVFVQNHKSRVMIKPTFWFPTWSNTNQAVQLQKMARGLKFWI